MPLKHHLPHMTPEKKKPINLPFHEPAYGYFEGMEDRVLRSIRETGSKSQSTTQWLSIFNWSLAGTTVVAVLAWWFFLPTSSAVSIDQINETELVQYLNLHADIQELASADPQLIHPSILPTSIPAPSDNELDEWIDGSTFDQIQEM